jgi:hypothetical protein
MLGDLIGFCPKCTQTSCKHCLFTATSLLLLLLLLLLDGVHSTCGEGSAHVARFAEQIRRHICVPDRLTALSCTRRSPEGPSLGPRHRAGRRSEFLRPPSNHSDFMVIH